MAIAATSGVDLNKYEKEEAAVCRLWDEVRADGVEAGRIEGKIDGRIEGKAEDIIDIFVTIQDLHSQNARIYILANYEVDWLDILLIGRLLPSLPMCKLYYIRKRKRTTCTYAAADPEQLQYFLN